MLLITAKQKYGTDYRKQKYGTDYRITEVWC